MRAREAGGLWFWLVLGVLIRLIQITQPFVDEWRWRESDTATVARNFHQHGFRIFYPQYNWAGDAPGYVGTEFQLVTALAAAVYLVVGEHEWVGRGVALAFYGLSMPFFYWLVRRIATPRAAFLALGIYTLTPLSVFASRTFMPDMPSLCCSLMALCWFVYWLDDETRTRWLVAAGLAAALAILVKITTVIFGLPLLYLAWRKHGPRLFGRPALWLFAGLALLPAVGWYLHTYFVSQAHPPYHMCGGDGVQFMDWPFYRHILYMTATMTLTPVLFGATLLSLLCRPRKEFGWLFHWWLVALVLFTVAVGYGNRHEWYRLALVPVAAALTAMAGDRLLERLSPRRGWLTIALFFVAFGWCAFVWLQPKYEAWGQPQWALGRELNRLVPRDALIVVADAGDPTTIYYSERRGWHFLEHFGIPAQDDQHAIRELEQLRHRGADFLGLTRYSFWWLKSYPQFRVHLDTHYRVASQTPDYIIYDLRAETAAPASYPSYR